MNATVFGDRSTASGIRLFDNPGGAPVPLDRVHDGAPNAELSVRFRPRADRG